MVPSGFCRTIWPRKLRRPEPSAAGRCSANMAFIATMYSLPSSLTTSFSSRSPAGEAAFPTCPRPRPYEGPGIPFLVEDVENREQMTELVRITCEALRSGPQRKRRK